MKIFTGAQIHELDKYTIEKEPINSIDLMERAAHALVRAITEVWGNDVPVVVFAACKPKALTTGCVWPVEPEDPEEDDPDPLPDNLST